MLLFLAKENDVRFHRIRQYIIAMMISKRTKRPTRPLTMLTASVLSVYRAVWPVSVVLVVVG